VNGPSDLTHLLRLLQLGDSALPVGGFSFSHGLESAVQQEVVRDAKTLDAYVRTALRQSATGDGVALLRASDTVAAGDLEGLVAIDRLVFERKLNEEVRVMTVRMGRKLVELVDAVAGGGFNAAYLGRIRAAEAPGTHPVALAVACARLGLTGRDGFAAQQYGVASTILGAALRLMRLSFVDTQRILHGSLADTPALLDEIESASAEEMSGFAPFVDVLASIHVKGHVRMFMN
jgi:urease accessory protein